MCLKPGTVLRENILHLTYTYKVIDVYRMTSTRDTNTLPFLDVVVSYTNNKKKMK